MDFPETFDEYKEYRSGLKAQDQPSSTPASGTTPAIRLNSYESAYVDWLRNKSPENMSKLLDTLSPTINSEITRYDGPRPIMRSRARVLAIKAIKNYNPMSGAKLSSWIVTNLQPLSRYGQSQRPVHAPEVAIRQAAAVARVSEELRDELGRDPSDDEIADEIGISAKRVSKVRGMVVPSVSTGQLDEIESEEGDSAISPGVVTPSKVPFAQEAVYMSLNPSDRFIFDSLTGSHGATQLSAKAVAAKLGVTPAAVSQHASAIASQIAEIANG